MGISSTDNNIPLNTSVRYLKTEVDFTILISHTITKTLVEYYNKDRAELLNNSFLCITYLLPCFLRACIKSF